MLTLTDSILDRIRNYPENSNKEMERAKELLTRLHDRRLYRFVDEGLIKADSKQLENYPAIATEMAKIANQIAATDRWLPEDFSLIVSLYE